MHDMKPCPFCGNPKVKLVKKTHNYTSSYDGRCIINYGTRGLNNGCCKIYRRAKQDVRGARMDGDN